MKVLIANRGECACRILRTCHALDIDAVTVATPDDQNARHIRLSKEHYILSDGGYVNEDQIIVAAQHTKATHIHPGWGFLSERGSFARAVARAGLIFIGPPPSAMEALGDKVQARILAEQNQIPVVPGGTPESFSVPDLLKLGGEIGYPLLIKATGGGGGRGMRVVRHSDDLELQVEAASREAGTWFGSSEIFFERLVEGARHIEVQIAADEEGNVVALGDRDCSLQRSYQKVVEEAPAPQLSPEIRAQLHDYSCRIAKAAGYKNLGTAEFLVDRLGKIYFLEVNGRLQVEHGITEEVIGRDLVELQLHLASSKPIPRETSSLASSSRVAIEVRLCAEQPLNNFAPSSGRITTFKNPLGVRIDTGFEQGDIISPTFDSMIAKIIAVDETREEALKKLTVALSDIEVSGVHTNIGFLKSLITCDEYKKIGHDTNTVSRVLQEVLPKYSDNVLPVAGLVAYEMQHTLGIATSLQPISQTPWDSLGRWSLNGFRPFSFFCRLEGFLIETFVEPLSAVLFRLTVGKSTPVYLEILSSSKESVFINIDDRKCEIKHYGAGWLSIEGYTFQIDSAVPIIQKESSKLKSKEISTIVSPLPGKVVALRCQVGDSLTAGQPLIVLESMKMEHIVTAPMMATSSTLMVEELFVTAGTTVSRGMPLVKIKYS